MGNILKRLIEYCEKNIGTGTLVLVGILIVKLTNKEFIRNLPVIGSFSLSEAELSSCVTLLNIVLWIFLIKFLIQWLINKDKFVPDFDMETYLSGFAKKIIFCSWAFLGILIFDQELTLFTFPQENHIVIEFIKLFPLAICLVITIGACFVGAFSEND